MPANIYDQHRASFANVSAFVVMLDGQRAATIAFKFPRDGAGRFLAYVHWIGAPMVRGYAGGYGYDKQSASLANAAAKLTLENGTYPDGTPYYGEEEVTAHAAFKTALSLDDGHGWRCNLEDAGFKVWGAV